MSTLAIVNPAAGGGRGAARARALCAGLPGVSVVHTEGPGHATELARAAGLDGIELVVAAGGDGTVFEVVNGLLAGEGALPRPALGILAIGTGNSFVRDFGLGEPAVAVEAIRAGRRRRIDALRVVTEEGDLYAVNIVSFGFSAAAGELTNRRFKGLGAFGYVSAVVVALSSLGAVPIEFSADGGPSEAGPFTLLSFCNSQFTGGAMHMAPEADAGDGLVDIVRIGPMGRRRFLASFPRIFRGTHPQMPEVALSRARAVAFARPTAQPILIDGEIRTVPVRAIEVLAGALELAA